MFNRKKLYTVVSKFLVVFILVFALSSCSLSGKITEYSLTILETNDLHGHFDTMPQYQTIVKQVRKECKNVILLDAGDVFKRGEYENYQGKIEMDIENAMGYNAMVLGNNEFKVPGSLMSTGCCGTLKESDSQISNLTKWANFPILCGNVKLTKTGKYINGTKPYIVDDLNGLRVGIIGVIATDPKDQYLDMTADKYFTSGEKEVQQLLPEVKKVSDVQIVLSHAGMKINRLMTGVAAIISGHDHIVTEKPEALTGIPIIQAGGETLHYLGRLDLNFKLQSGKWVLSSYNGKLYSSNGVVKDADIQKIIDKYKALPMPTPNVEQ